MTLKCPTIFGPNKLVNNCSIQQLKYSLLTLLKIKGDINTTKNENSKFPLGYINILVCKIRPSLEDIILNKTKDELISPHMPYAEART